MFRFSSAGATTTAPTATGFGSFGAAPASTTAAPAQSTTSGFGGFGASTSAAPGPTATSGFGGFGTAASAAPATAAAQPQATAVDWQRSTKYNDLPADVQAKLDGFHRTVHNQSHIAEQLDTEYTDYVVQTISRDVEALVYKLTALRNQLERDSHAINGLRGATVKELDHEEMARRLFDNMMKHGGPGSVGVAERPFYHAQDYIWRYFVELSASLDKKMGRYQTLLEDLERQLTTLVGKRRSAAGDVMSPQIALDVARNNYDTFLALAAKVAAVHDQLERQKEQYMRWRSATGKENLDPFTSDRGITGSKYARTGVSGAKHVTGSKMAELFEPATLSDMAKRIATPSQTGAGQQQAAQTTTLGASQTAAPAAASTFGGFGTAGGSMFGAKPAAAPSTTTPSFGFGASTTAQPAATAPSTSFGGFGASTTQPAAAAAPTTSFGFGSSTAQPAAAAPTTTTGFGGFGGFGSTATKPATQSTPATGGFGGFGASATAAPAASAAVPQLSFTAATPTAGGFGGFGGSSGFSFGKK